mgnify:CR=1 FL=1
MIGDYAPRLADLAAQATFASQEQTVWEGDDVEYALERADWERLWKFVEDTGLYYVNISPMTPLPGAEIYPLYRDQLTVPENAHGLFDLSHMLLPTKMPLKDYYRELLRLYSRTILNLSRAQSVTQRTLATPRRETSAGSTPRSRRRL